MKQDNENNQGYQSSKYLLSKSNKLDPYRIKNNYLSNIRYDYENINYTLEQINKINENIDIHNQQNNNKKIFNKNTKFQCDSISTSYYIDQVKFNHSVSSKIESKAKQQSNQEHQEDFNQLWDIVQMEMKQSFQSVEKCQKNTSLSKSNTNNFNQTPQNTQPKSASNDSDSSLQLTLEQLEVLMQPIKQHRQTNLQKQNEPTNCTYMMNQVKTQPVQTKQDWGQWTDVCEVIDGEELHLSKQIISKKEIHLANIQQNGMNNQYHKSTLGNNNLQQQQPCFNYKDNYDQIGENQKKCRYMYGPWKFNTQLYKLHYNCAFQQIQQLMIQTKSDMHLDKSLQGVSDGIYTSLRKINWQIIEEKKIQNKAEEQKKSCKSTLLQHGKDFLIFDHYKLIYSPIREGVHLYFGIRSYGDFSWNSDSQYEREHQTQKFIPMKDFLYLSSNGECLLQTYYEKHTNNVNKFNIVLCLTKQKVAICQRIICNQFQDRRQFVEIRAFDRFQNAQLEYLGLIQSKISKFYGKWYCDTTIYIPKKKIYTKKFNQKNWDKLKMKLKVSEMGTIAAQLGILVAKSSVTNCILLSENNAGQFMMGTVDENSEETNYIVRIEGISPIIAFATAVCRKFFVFYS